MIATEQLTRGLRLDATLHLAGLPDSVALQEGLVSESFKGCLRNIRLNAVQVDLLSSSNSVTGIGRCFDDVERGAYFDGDAYAVFSEIS